MAGIRESGPLTHEEIAEIRDLLAKATAAPWVPYSQKGGRPGLVRAGRRQIFLAVEHEPGIDDTGTNCQADHDVLLTVVARNKLERLLDELGVLRQAAAAAKALVRARSGPGSGQMDTWQVRDEPAEAWRAFHEALGNLDR